MNSRIGAEESLSVELQAAARLLENPTAQAFTAVQSNLSRAIKIAQAAGTPDSFSAGTRTAIQKVAKLLESARGFHDGLTEVRRRASALYGPAGEIQYSFSAPALDLEG